MVEREGSRDERVLNWRWSVPMVVVLSALVALVFPFVAGASGRSDLKLIVEPDQGIQPIYRLLASPHLSLDLTMYELRDSKAEQILAGDAKRGVRVRVLLDRDFVGQRENSAAFSYLRHHKVKVRWASHQVEITHQKSFVVDGHLAVVMTGNLTSEYYSTTRDFTLIDRQTKDVKAIEKTFNLDWQDRKGIAPNGADLVWSPGSEAKLVSLIGSAHHSLLVENEEMKAPEIISGLVAASKRGVKVTVVMTRESDWYDAFDTLVKAGVDVSTYSESAPLYIHAKVIVVDSRRAFLGSENFSVGSMQYNRELGLITSASPIVHSLVRTVEKDAAGGQRWTP
jgi:cardiolipin synthase A/B